MEITTLYERHRPELTLLYKLIEKHYPALIEQLEAQGKSLPLHVHQEFEAYLKFKNGDRPGTTGIITERCRCDVFS